MRRLFLIALLLGVAPSAQASIFQEHTSRDDIQAREVERGLVRGKGWVQIELGFSWKQSKKQFLSASGPFALGPKEDWANNAVYSYRVFHLRGSWGMSRRAELFIEAPWVWQRISSDNLSEPVSAFSLGDATFGWRHQWVRTEKNGFRTSMVTDVTVKVPSGNESPGSYLGGPQNVHNLISGTGTYSLGLMVGLKQQLGFLAFEVWAGLVHKPSAIVMYILETETNQFNARIDPGDEVRANVGLTVSPVRPLWVRVDFKNSYRGATRLGVSSEGIPACKTCEPVEGTGGVWGDLRATGGFWSVKFPLGFEVYYENTLWGRSSRAFWPLEELTPSAGWTAGGNVFARF